jgi:hypothetical protein
VEQSHRATSPVKRALRWRYATAVQAARMLNSLAPESDHRRPEPNRRRSEPVRTLGLSQR